MLYVQFGGGMYKWIRGSISESRCVQSAGIPTIMGSQNWWFGVARTMRWESTPPRFWRVHSLILGVDQVWSSCLISKLHCLVFLPTFFLFSVLPTLRRFDPRKVVDFEERSASQLQYLQQSLESKAWRPAWEAWRSPGWWFEVSHEKRGPWLFRVYRIYRGWNAAQLCMDLSRDYNKPL